jgi:type IX secretion system PorP/SprF family membrane protein
MKRILYIVILVLINGSLFGQQLPFMEGHNINSFGMSPAYAGLQNVNTLFSDYRTDWSGMAGGPVTCQFSYNTRLFKNVGAGARYIYDKTDIFKQTLILGTYTYEVRIAERHFFNFGLSAGFYRNSIDVAKYFNDPDYVIDGVLITGMEKSQFKFVSDASFLYRFGNLESGFLFSNLMVGSVKYNNPDLSYKPFKNYMAHAAYNFEVSDRLELKPMVILRGGKNAPDQVETAVTATWDKKVWATGLYRTGGILGFGAGMRLFDGLLLNYSYNMSTGVALNTFGSHQVTLGFRLFKPGKRAIPETYMPKASEAPMPSKARSVKEPEKENVPVILPAKEEPKAEEVKITKPELAVKQTDEKPLAPINLRIVFTKNRVIVDSIVSFPENGKYKTSLMPGVYSMEISASGYVPATDKIEIKAKGEELSLPAYKLSKIEKGIVFKFKNVGFTTGTDKISGESFMVLDMVSKLLKENPTMKLEVSGHTDDVGTKTVNEALSQKRAEAVSKYLILKGIQKERLNAKGYGSVKPVAENSSAEGRTQNRRVEFTVLEF